MIVPRETEPVLDEHPDMEGGGIEVRQVELVNDEGESPLSLYEDGSGQNEGSAAGGLYIADRGLVTGQSETGSGENDMDLFKGNYSCSCVYRFDIGSILSDHRVSGPR